MQNPGFVTLNGHRIKVQRWQHDAGVFTFTTIIRGEHLGNDVMAAIQTPEINLGLDEKTSFNGTARLLDRRSSGAGTTAVVRLEIQFAADGESLARLELTPDQKLDAILEEVRALRQELRALRDPRPMASDGEITLSRPGSTMLDFELPVEEDTLE